MTQLLTMREAGEKLKVSRYTLYRLIERGELKSVKIGGSRRIALRELERLVDRKAR